MLPAPDAAEPWKYSSPNRAAAQARGSCSVSSPNGSPFRGARTAPSRTLVPDVYLGSAYTRGCWTGLLAIGAPLLLAPIANGLGAPAKDTSLPWERQVPGAPGPAGSRGQQCHIRLDLHEQRVGILEDPPAVRAQQDLLDQVGRDLAGRVVLGRHEVSQELQRALREALLHRGLHQVQLPARDGPRPLPGQRALGVGQGAGWEWG